MPASNSYSPAVLQRVLNKTRDRDAVVATLVTKELLKRYPTPAKLRSYLMTMATLPGPLFDAKTNVVDQIKSVSTKHRRTVIATTRRARRARQEVVDNVQRYNLCATCQCHSVRINIGHAAKSNGGKAAKQVKTCLNIGLCKAAPKL